MRRWIETGRARQLRIEAGMTLAEAADAMESNAQTVHRWERGERMPLGRNLRAYHQYLTGLEADRKSAPTP